MTITAFCINAIQKYVVRDFWASLLLTSNCPSCNYRLSYLPPHNCKGVHGKYPLLQDGFLVVAICCWLVALCWNVISCDLESFPNCISKENLVLSSAGFEYYSQEFRDRAYVWRLITLVWELLSGQTGAFLKSSGPQLSVENKNSWILYRHHWENRIWREQT